MNNNFDYEFVKDIFYNSNVLYTIDRQLIIDIQYLLESNLLQCEVNKVYPKNSYHKYIDKIKSKKIAHIDIQGGDVSHMALKMIGKDYLLKKGIKNIFFEKEFEGYFPDLMSGDASILFECGNTNPDKVFKYFKNKKIKHLYILPYPSNNDIKLKLYDFTPSSELSDFLIFKEKEELKIAFQHKSKLK